MHLPKQVQEWNYIMGFSSRSSTKPEYAQCGGHSCLRKTLASANILDVHRHDLLHIYYIKLCYRKKVFWGSAWITQRYERNEARYILQLPKNYDTINISFGIDKNEMKRLVIALAELDLTIDEWLCFKMNELVLADRQSKENRGEK